jgi:ATP adenylyltransferase
MQSLHAYWRAAYVETPKKQAVQSNIFLNLPKQSDKEAYIVWRGVYTYIVLNIFPYNSGHLLVVPYRQMQDLSEFKPHEYSEFWEAIVKAQTLLTETLKPNGFNIGFNIGRDAGGSITNHVHCHIVPRWQGDNNFMPVIAETKIISHALDALWEKLTNYLRSAHAQENN